MGRQGQSGGAVEEDRAAVFAGEAAPRALGALADEAVGGFPADLVPPFVDVALGFVFRLLPARLASGFLVLLEFAEEPVPLLEALVEQPPFGRVHRAGGGEKDAAADNAADGTAHQLGAAAGTLDHFAGLADHAPVGPGDFFVHPGVRRPGVEDFLHIVDDDVFAVGEDKRFRNGNGEGRRGHGQGRGAFGVEERQRVVPGIGVRIQVVRIVAGPERVGGKESAGAGVVIAGAHLVERAGGILLPDAPFAGEGERLGAAAGMGQQFSERRIGVGVGRVSRRIRQGQRIAHAVEMEVARGIAGGDVDGVEQGAFGRPDVVARKVERRCIEIGHDRAQPDAGIVVVAGGGAAGSPCVEVVQAVVRQRGAVGSDQPRSAVPGEGMARRVGEASAAVVGAAAR